MIETRAALVAAGFTLSFFALAGCGGGDEGPTVASAASGPAAASATPGGGTVAAYVEAQRKWVACMREQGFDYPDPNARGQFEISGEVNRKFKADPRFIPAQDACKEFQKEVPAELEPKEDPLTPEQIRWRREHAACMRENGVPDYPDPDANGNMPENWGGSGEQTQQEQAVTLRAMQICEPVRQGRPKGTPDPSATYAG